MTQLLGFGEDTAALKEISENAGTLADLEGHINTH